MKKLLLSLTFIAMLTGLAEAQQISDARVADFVQAGKIRVGVHSVMYKKDPQTGEPKEAGVGIILQTLLAHSANGSGLISCRSDFRPFPRC